MSIIRLCLTFIIIYCHKCLSEDTSFEWNIFNADHFTGFIYEDQNFIRVSPEIKLKTTADLKLCNFILTSKNGKELPFLVNLKSSSEGTGQLITTGDVHFDNYEFYIKAKACDKDIFSRELKIILRKEKGEVPLWVKSVYNAIVKDDIQPGSEVVRVKAYELGRSSKNSICDYKIVAPIDAPFDIDGNGVVRSTNYLDAHKHRNYVLRVMAIDCWVPKSRNSSVSVNIEVKRVCKFGWNGVFQQINYVPGSGIRRLGENIKFHECGQLKNQCTVRESMVQLTLNYTENKMCDKDISSLRNQWKNCGMNNHTEELLPSADLFTREAQGTANSFTGIYSFDGENTRWEIPTNVIPKDHFLGENFTISFWMRHDRLTGENKHKKEQILCNSDGDGKNRHHYSLFLHNCKLIFLYRTEPSTNQGTTLTPAEWRFKSNEICDSEWHHYSLVVEIKHVDNSIDLPNSLRQVRLFIDGASFPSDIDNPEIIDDVPMHEISQVHFTKLVIGACWRSKSLNYIQHFRGQLSGMTVLRGHVESSSVIECVNKCNERLKFTGINKMAPGTSISINSMMSSMIITASNVEDIRRIFEQIGYINSRWKPLPGKRTIDITTSIKCLDFSKTFTVPQKIVSIVVLAKDDSNGDKSNSVEDNHNKDYALKVTGDTVIEIDSVQIVTPGVGLGLQILSNVMITDLSKEGLGSLLLWGKPTVEGNRRRYRINGVSTIESCLLSAHPTLDNPHEYLSFTTNVIQDLSDQGIYLNVTNSSLGLIIEGSQSVSIYRFVLQRIVYLNSRLENFNGKIFKLVCSKNSAHSISNELVVKLQISDVVKGSLSNLPSKVYHSNIPIHDDPSFDGDQVEHHGLSETARLNLPKNGVKMEKVSSNLVVVLTVCGIIVVAIIVLGLLRMIRQKNQRLGIPFSRNIGPWVRLKPDTLGFLGNKETLMRNNQNRKILPISATNGEMEWDNSEMYSSSLMDDSLQITVNPLLDHEKTLRMINSNKHLSSAELQFDAEERSLDGLPDEYDGKSEDFREFDDDMTIEDDCNSLMDDVDIPKFYQNGQSLSQNAINEKNRTWFGRLNIHQNPRYSLDSTYSK